MIEPLESVNLPIAHFIVILQNDAIMSMYKWVFDEHTAAQVMLENHGVFKLSGMPFGRCST